MKRFNYLTAFFVLFFCANLNAQELNKPILDSVIRQCVRTNSNALLIYQKGKPVYKNYFGKPIEKIEAMSATKSVVSIALGILLDKNFIDSLDQPVYTIYPEWKQGNKKLITIRHLMNHSSGMQNVMNAGEEVEVAPDIVQLALCAELENTPGTRFSYNNKACNLLSGIIEKTSKLKLDKFLNKYLFNDLGIKDFTWRTDDKGNPYAMAGLIIYPEDFAKIGSLILNQGNWNGKQLISKNWINEMLTPSKNNNNYGLQWWLTSEKQYYALDDAFFASIKDRTDEITFDLVQKLKGNYKEMSGIGEKARSIYTPEELKLVGKLMQNVPPSNWRIENEGEILNYGARGYLGQYLIIIPKKDLVIVTMINAENYKKVPNNPGFQNFHVLVNEL